MTRDEARHEIDKDRREFVRRVLAGTIGGTLLLVLPVGARGVARRIAQLGEERDLPPRDSKYAFVVDVGACIGCGACGVADREEYQVPDGHYRTWVERYVIDDRDQVYVDSPDGGQGGFAVPREDVEHPVRDTFYVPKLCNMCERPSCVQVCPVGATFRSADGFVLVDQKRCVGCAYCVQACPYSARFMNPGTRTAEKCTWCYHRRRQGKAPACVASCPTGARKFGDLLDGSSDVYRLLHEPHVVSVLKPDMGNRPSLHYLGLRREVV